MWLSVAGKGKGVRGWHWSNAHQARHGLKLTSPDGTSSTASIEKGFIREVRVWVGATQAWEHAVGNPTAVHPYCKRGATVLLRYHSHGHRDAHGSDTIVVPLQYRCTTVVPSQHAGRSARGAALRTPTQPASKAGGYPWDSTFCHWQNATAPLARYSSTARGTATWRTPKACRMSPGLELPFLARPLVWRCAGELLA